MTSKTRTCWIGSLKNSPVLSGQEEHQGLADGVSFPLIKLFLIEELILLPGDEERMELAAALMDPRDTAHLSPPDQSLPPAPPISSSPALDACHPTFFPKYMSALEDFKMVVPDGRVNFPPVLTVRT